ncbi:MAG: hypothetical protein HY290_16610 [Planctomycetia bacterium]|nr:hypothetical protein [Planctomycetia bacterium]
MGLFCVNLHFRTCDHGALAEALDRGKVSQRRITSAKNGWVSLYEERASQQDDEWIRELALDLSRDLRVAAIAFMVHDSDIACYWLVDNGRLIDEYNSCPDYFEADSATDISGPSGGRADLLLPYCRTGVREGEIAAILGKETLFAEEIIERLAQALGIAPERALTDYGDGAEGEGPDGGGGFGGGDDDEGDDFDDDGDGGPGVSPLQARLAGQVAKMFGAAVGPPSADPGATALVQAAADDDGDEIDRLLADGVAIETEAPAPVPGQETLAGVGVFGPTLPKIPMTPLLAAVANKRQQAAERLLKRGADPNHTHPLFGSPVHAATGAGEVRVLELLINHGGDVNARDARGQTPLQVIAAGRATTDRLAQVQAMMKTMGMQVPGMAGQLTSMKLPTEGWNDCEQLLKAHGAR